MSGLSDGKYLNPLVEAGEHQNADFVLDKALSTPIRRMRFYQRELCCASQQIRGTHVRFGSWSFQNVSPVEVELRETVNEPFFDFGYARIAAISG